MTNVTNAVNTTETTETNAVEAVKNTRVTVQNTLFPEAPEFENKEARTDFIAAQAKLLANILVPRGKDTVKLADDIWKAAQKTIPEAIKAIEAEQAKAEADKAAQLKLQAEEAEKAKAVLEEKKEEMIKVLIDGGMQREMAIMMFENMQGKNVKTVDRITVDYNGKVMEIAKTGNAKKEVQEAMAETGLTRDEFIAKYRTDAVTAE